MAKHDNYLMYCLRGASQVFFMENALSGLLIIIAVSFAAMAAGTWQIAVGAVLGLTISTATAMLFRCDSASLQAGLYGFNGILVGAAVPTFIELGPALWFYLILGAIFSVILTEAFSTLLTKTFGVPGSTGPFVLCGMLLVSGAYSFGHLEISSLSEKFNTDYVSETYFIPDGAQLLAIFLKNISQVYLLDNAVSGAIILAAVLIASVRAGLAAAGGSALAIIVAIFLGAPPEKILSGLYGYSAVLTAMAIGVIFLKPSIWVSLYALLATAVTVVVQGAFDSLVLPAGLPSFTAPYVVTMSLFMLPRKALAPHPHAPALTEHPFSK